MWGILAEAIARYLPEKRGVLMTSFSLADATRLEHLFRSAGFRNVGVVRETRAGIIENVEEYWEAIEVGIGSIPQSYLLLSAAERRSVREDVKTRFAAFMQSDGLHMSLELLIGSGEAD